MRRIERAIPQQAERLFEIMVRATEIGCAPSYPPEIMAIWQKGRTAAGMADVIAGADVHCLIEGEAVRGFVHIEGSEIVGLFVDPAAQRKGYGAELFRFAIGQIRTRPVVVRATLNAVPFYARLGCRKVAVELVRRHDRDIYVERMELG